MSTSTVRCSGMSRVNDGYTVLLATHTFISSGMIYTFLYSPAAKHHCILAGTHFPSCWGQEAELAWCYNYQLLHLHYISISHTAHTLPFKTLWLNFIVLFLIFSLFSATLVVYLAVFVSTLFVLKQQQHSFNGFFSRTAQIGQYQKVKPF